MSGKSGRSGGARPGCGRKKKAPVVQPLVVDALAATSGAPQPAKRDPLEYLLAVVADPSQPATLRVRAAVAAAQYLHLKKHDGGIKDGIRHAADKASRGKFSPATPPKLVVNNP